MCQESESKLTMYFTVNLAFINYFDNLIDSLKFSILLNRTTYKQILPISFKTFDFEPQLLKASKTLKDFVYQFQHENVIFDLQEQHVTRELEKVTKFLFDNHAIDVFFFVSAIISLLVVLEVLFIICKHINLK